MKIELYKPYKTRNGEKAVPVDKTEDRLTVCYVGRFWRHNIGGCTEDGYYHEDKRLSAHDLVAPWEEPKRGTIWINLYDYGFVCVSFATQEEADENAGKDRIACKRVLWTEGDRE